MKRLLSILALLIPLSLHAEYDPRFGDDIDRTAEDFVTVSLCVAEPTNWRDDVLGIHGHAFLRLQCPIFNLDYCYSYESERVNGQLLKYWFNKLKMGMYAIPTQDYIVDYRKWNRAVHEYILAIPPDADQRLWEVMDNHLLEGNQLVLDLSERGCASSAADYVVEALRPYRIEYASKPARNDFIIPARLAEIWQNATLDGKPFAVYAGDLVEADPPTWWDIWFDAGAFAIALAVIAAVAVSIVLVCRRKRKPRG
ncbi:MAG: hypothetical protein MJY89_03365 [Bacteroidales bacterium]|nr:hypothetical protein [Bacteroidales bacterium]